MTNKFTAEDASGEQVTYSEKHTGGEGFMIGVSSGGRVDLLLLEKWPEDDEPPQEVLATLGMCPDAVEILIKTLQRALLEGKIRWESGPTDSEKWQ